MGVFGKEFTIDTQFIRFKQFLINAMIWFTNHMQFVNIKEARDRV